MVTRKLTLAQLASVGEGAIGRLAQNPVTHKAVEGALQLKERVEKLVTGFEALEQRLTAVEQRLDALEKSSKRTRRTTVRPVRPAARIRPVTRSTSATSEASTSASDFGERPRACCAPIDRRRRRLSTGRGSRLWARA